MIFLKLISKKALSIFVLILLISAIGIASPDSSQSSIQLKTFVEQDEVPLNREVVYIVELNWTGSLNKFQLESIEEPLTNNLKLSSSGSSNRFYQDENGLLHSVKRITYYFTPLEMGMAYIDGVIIKYKDIEIEQNASLMAQRLGVKIIHPVKDSRDSMFTGTLFLWLITILFLGIVLFFLIKYWQRRKQIKKDEQITPITLEQKYMELLHETIHPSGDAPDENLNELMRLLNSYIAEKWQLGDIVGFNSLLSKLNEYKVDKDLELKLEALYKRGELTKFAGESLNQTEFHLYYDSVELLLKHMMNPELEIN